VVVVYFKVISEH